MANYVVDPEILRQYLPVHTELDFWEGNCYMSLVAFLFINTKLKSYSIPFHRNFEEVNLRFYVRFREKDIWKRGVVFIREFVPLPMVTMVANTLYDEKYATVPVQHKISSTPERLEIIYRWKRNMWHSFSAEAVNKSTCISEGSKEEFITQHFWGYAKKKRFTSEYQVQHDKWESYPLTGYSIDVNFAACYGDEFSILDTIKPESVLLVEGSPIRVYRDKKIF